MQRFVRSALLGILLVPAFAGVAAAKGDAMAALDTAIPPDADPGTELEVGWRAWVPDGGGEWPFTGSPLFIRVTSPDGHSSTEAMGREEPPGSGHYVAIVVVPSGGIGLVEIGLLGESCVNGACSRSDIMFELQQGQRVPTTAAAAPVEPPVRAPAEAIEPGPGSAAHESATRDDTVLAPALIAGGLLIALAIGLLGRGRATTGPARVAAPAPAGLRGDRA